MDCSCCCQPVDLDGWDGLDFCRGGRVRSSRVRTKQLVAVACSSSIPSVDPYARKQVVGQGLKRFEVGKIAPKQPDFEQISSRVWSVLGQNPSNFTLNGTNCYIVGTGKKRILIDTGESHFGNKVFMSKLEECMQQIGCEGFAEILITHQHHDHYGGVGHLLKKYGSDIPIGKLPLDNGNFQTMIELKKRRLIPCLEDSDGNPYFVPKKGDRALPTPAQMKVWPDEDAESGAILAWDRFNRTKAELVRDYGFIRDSDAFHSRLTSEYNYHVISNGEVLEVEGATLRCLHTPGHAEDHCSFWLKEENCLFSGDHVLGFGTTVMQNLYDYMASLDIMLKLRPVHLYPGHGPVIEEGTDFIQRYVEHRNVRERQIVSTMANYFQTNPGGPGLSSTMLAGLIYTKTPKGNMWMAIQNVERVLLKLDREGRATAYKQSGNELVRVNLPQKGFVMALDTKISWFLHKQAAALITGQDRGDQFLQQLRQLERNTPDDLFQSMTDKERSEAKDIVNNLDSRLWNSLTNNRSLANRAAKL